MEPAQDIERISPDLEEYSKIAMHYRQNPQEIELNHSHLLNITEDLLYDSDEGSTPEAKNLRIELLNFFLEASNYV